MQELSTSDKLKSMYIIISDLSHTKAKFGLFAIPVEHQMVCTTREPEGMSIEHL